MAKLDGKIALITGRSSGIGLATGISPTRASEDCSSISRAIAAFGHDLAADGVAQPKRSSRFKSVSTLSIK